MSLIINHNIIFVENMGGVPIKNLLTQTGKVNKIRVNLRLWILPFTFKHDAWCNYFARLFTFET